MQAKMYILFKKIIPPGKQANVTTQLNYEVETEFIKANK
jgi:hypothetical protein